MRRYLRTTVTGVRAGDGLKVSEDIVFEEGQDPVVLAFRRNNALAGMSAVRMTAPEEAFCAGTADRPERAPTPRELKKKARDEAYRERMRWKMNERFSGDPPRRRGSFKGRELAPFRPRFGPGSDGATDEERLPDAMTAGAEG